MLSDRTLTHTLGLPPRSVALWGDAVRGISIGLVALVLAGHTHGGQVRIPGRPVLVRMSRYRLDEGRYTAGECELIVSRGLGASGLPLRVYCPPEAIVVTLRAGDRTPP